MAPRTAHNVACEKACNWARSALSGRLTTGLAAGSRGARSRLVACPTAAPAGPTWCGSPARQTFRLVQPEGWGTRPFSGCRELAVRGALTAAAPAPLATVGAVEAAQQQREALRFIDLHCEAGQGRESGRARAGEAERRAASTKARRRGEAGRQGRGSVGRAGTAAAGKAQLPGRQHQLGDGTRREATGCKARGQVGGRRPGGNVSPTRSAGRRGDHECSHKHIGGAGGQGRGKRFPYPIRLIPAQGVSAFTPLDLCQPGADARGASRELGQGPGWGMSLVARRGGPGRNVSPTSEAGTAMSQDAGGSSSRREGRGNVSPTLAIRE